MERLLLVRWCWRLLLFLVLALMHHTSCRAAASKFDRKDGHPVPEFSQHRIFKPRIYHGREKRELTSTREENGHTHDITVGFDVDGKDYILDLKLNRDLIPSSYFEKYHHQGQYVINTPTAKEVELCHYQGQLRGVPGSWAVISTCYGLSGMVYDGQELHYLERVPGDKNNLHFLYRHSDMRSNQTCGYSGTHHIMADQEVNRILRYKRSTETIRGPYNANRKSRYVELVLVVDNKEYKELGEDLPKTFNRCKEIANIVNALYVPLNIFIALVGVVVWNEQDEIPLSNEGDVTLTKFLQYRRERLVKQHPNDNAQLLTGVQFAGGVVGKALKGPICTYEFSGGVNMDHSALVALVATTVAHELGHNFGMEHDSDDCQCPSERCIMAPSSSSLSPTHWSSCSLEYLALAFEHGMDYCLRNRPRALFDGPVCGNGFVEPGEECDCGLADHCENPCCNATSCTLYPNATCATGECCDLRSCRPKTPGTPCRSAEHECDLPEYCTGESEYCPPDVYKIDGEVCSKGRAYCYEGSCRTHTDQCRLLWGPSGKNSDGQCYSQNNKGTRNGNCGYLRLNQSYLKCQDDNVLCGMLHCSHLNERLEFGMESVSILSHTFINTGGRIIPCRSAIVDLGLNEVDPGLAPDGARCGEGKMCVNQKCMPVQSLQKGGCPFNCNGKGVCNSRGHCHCSTGFAPPYCDYPGPGGSDDSGPASDPNGSSDFVTALYVIFLGIIPLVAIMAFLGYYTQKNVKQWCTPGPLQASQTKSQKYAPRCRPPSFKSEANGLRKVDISNPIRGADVGAANSDGATVTLLPKPQENGFVAPAPPQPAAANARVGAIPDNMFGQFKGFSLTPLQPDEPPSYESVMGKTKQRPLSSPEVNRLADESDGSQTALQRITSFLRPSKGTLQRKKIDRDSLRSLHISGPILQPGAVPVRPAPPPPDAAPDSGAATVSRTQSLRSEATPRVNIHSFGSMRGRRPVSIPTARPTSPPPRPPPPKPPKSDSTPSPQDSIYYYDDCVNLITGNAPLAHIDEESSPMSGDNIYAVIEEPVSPVVSPPPPSPPEPPPMAGYVSPTAGVVNESKSGGSSESLGLLSEIVSEIQSRNLDSIYSTFGRRKKKGRPAEDDPDETDSTEGKRPDSVSSTSSYVRPTPALYSNMGQSGTGPYLSFKLKPVTTAAPATTAAPTTSPEAAPVKSLRPTVATAAAVKPSTVASRAPAAGPVKPAASSGVPSKFAPSNLVKPSAVSASAAVKPSGAAAKPSAVSATSTSSSAKHSVVTSPTAAPSGSKPDFSTFKGPLKTYSLDSSVPKAAVAPTRKSPATSPVNKTDDEKVLTTFRPAPPVPGPSKPLPAVPTSRVAPSVRGAGTRTGRGATSPTATAGVAKPGSAGRGRTVASLQQKFESASDGKRTNFKPRGGAAPAASKK